MSHLGSSSLNRARAAGAAALLFALVAAMVATLAVEPAQARQDQRTRLGVGAGAVVRAPIGSDPMLAGQGYTGDFPDPTVLSWGGEYYAYSTSTDSLNLPVLVSRGLRRWSVPAANPITGSTDAMPVVASWANWTQVGARRVAITWAPSVARIHGRFVAAYATQRRSDHRMCISVAVSYSPLGPFVDRSTRPLLCPWNRGAIDPQLYQEKGRVYLLYKTEDISIGKATRLWIVRLRAGGLQQFPGATSHLLLRALSAPSWENRVIENPGLIRFRGRRYLFYSGNGWGSPNYAIGYAVCAKLFGPCVRPTRRTRVHGRSVTKPVPPLLASDSVTTAPGGDFPFVGRGGALRLAYHAWNAGQKRNPPSAACRTTTAGCAQRRLHIARLAASRSGVLTVVARDATPGG